MEIGDAVGNQVTIFVTYTPAIVATGIHRNRVTRSESSIDVLKSASRVFSRGF